MKINFTHKATIKLNRIYIYYKELGNGMKGRRIRVAILKKLKRLKKNPEMGQVEENLLDESFVYRYLVEGNYKIIYRIEDQTVYITDIFDTRQDPSKM